MPIKLTSGLSTARHRPIVVPSIITVRVFTCSILLGPLCAESLESRVGIESLLYIFRHKGLKNDGPRLTEIFNFFCRLHEHCFNFVRRFLVRLLSAVVSVFEVEEWIRKKITVSLPFFYRRFLKLLHF